MQDCRLLTPDDIHWVVEELRDLPNQSTMFKDVPDDPVYVRMFLLSWMRQGLFGVCDASTRSFILAHISSPWYANRKEVSEVILWVPKEHRGARNALKLIRSFTEVALDYEPYCITAGASLDISNNDKTLSLYELCGYSRDGHGVRMRP